MRCHHLTILIAVALVGVQELSTIAARERGRRRALRAEGPAARLFTDADLEARGSSSPATGGRRRRSAAQKPRSRPKRDLAKEERYWRKETLVHERAVARLDQRIRQLESRLRTLPSVSSRGSAKDRASRALLEDALDALAADKARLEARFRERARKGGAFPGWLR